jgi:OmcA/MtrC family decaheme c-type cytochrome
VAPFVAASGSGTVFFEGHLNKNVAATGEPDVRTVPLTFALESFSIDEAGGVASQRREVVDIAKCNVCHAYKSNHGSNRNNDTQGCVGCHNPKNTDRSVRELREASGAPMPGDGKQEESIDFKRLIHALHGSGFRETPLEVVGYGGFSVHVFDEEHIQYPGNIANCLTCHNDGTYELPLGDNVEGSTIDTGVDIADPADDTMISKTAAVCSSCHDNDIAKAHMEHNGGDFSATPASISTESCVLCHGSGGVADLEVVHDL